MTDYDNAKLELEALNKLFSPEADYNFDFQDLCFDVVENLKKSENPNNTIKAVLECFEKQPTSNFGVHAELFGFIESLDLDKLENEVLESINRKPVPQTVWLLKKLINKGNNNQKLINLLQSIAMSEDIDKETKETAKMFLIEK